MDDNTKPHLTDTPNWHIVPIEGGWRRGPNLIPLRREWNELDDKIKFTFMEEFELIRASPVECVISPRGQLQRSVYTRGMFTDLRPTINVGIVRAMLSLKFGFSYANLMAKLLDGHRLQFFSQCDAPLCINPDHYRLSRASRSKIMDHIGPITSTISQPLDNEFYSAFEKAYKKWEEELINDLGTPEYRRIINERALTWFNEWKVSGNLFVTVCDPMDLIHPLNLMIADNVEPSPEVKALFDILATSAPALDTRVTHDDIMDMLKRKE
jgi:hypothetical protein